MKTVRCTAFYRIRTEIQALVLAGYGPFMQVDAVTEDVVWAVKAAIREES